MKALSAYDAKRDFTITSEPPGATQIPNAGEALRFVVQMHDASRLHYDFRLEVGGVLRSWAVPKGLPAKKGDRRLAVPTEDHPMAYAGFEGNIPKGQYGGGTVIVWDEGTFVPEGAASREEAEALAAKGLEAGKLNFRLEGSKASGEFTLVRTEKEDAWLLLRRDAGGKAPHDRSVRTDRSLDEVREGKKAEAERDKRIPIPLSPPGERGQGVRGQGHGAGDLEAASMRLAESHTQSTDKQGERRKPPHFLAPMLPEETAKAFDDPAWTFEIKLDGIRAIALRDGAGIRLLTRQGNDVADRFPSIVEDLRKLTDEGFGFDGEIVVTDEKGRPSFPAVMEILGLRHGRAKHGGGNAQYWIFDMTYAEGRDLRRLPLRARRAALEALCPSSKSLRVLDTYPEHGNLLYEQAVAMGFEGIVAKRLDSPYRDGQRSADWRKVKRYHTEEFLVAGYTRGMGSREHTFGALLLARRTEDGLRFCGSVGGGFSDVRLESLKKLLDEQRETASPFAASIETKGAPRFVEPKTMVEVRFMEWTRDGRLRMPQFVRLRPDLESSTPPISTSDDEVDSILAALDEGRPDVKIRVDGHEITLTSLDKVLWPAYGPDPAVTKRDLLAYYARISAVLLPHLKDRPLAIVRHPEGIAAPGFFQKHLDGAPDFVARRSIWSSHNKGPRDWMMCNDLATLMWLGQMSVVEIHPWYSRVTQEPDAHGYGVEFATEQGLDDSVLSLPDFVVFDLDPAFPGLAPEEWWEPTARAGLALRELLSNVGLRSYPKTSGKAGLHLYVPLRRDHDYAELRALAEGLGRHLAEDRSLGITLEWNLSKRPAGIFFDYRQNVRGKTLAAAYSPRPVAGATVSMPLKWSEVASVQPGDFHLANVPSFIAERGDAWADLLADCQTLWFNPE